MKTIFDIFAPSKSKLGLSSLLFFPYLIAYFGPVWGLGDRVSDILVLLSIFFYFPILFVVNLFNLPELYIVVASVYAYIIVSFIIFLMHLKIAKENSARQ